MNFWLKSAWIPLAVLFFVAAVLFLFSETWSGLRTFSKKHFSYDEIRANVLPFSTGLAAKQVIPPDALVEVSSSWKDVSTVVIRYVLYPIRVMDGGDYRIDWDKSIVDTLPDWQKYTLPTGVNIYARKGLPFLSPPHPSEKTISLAATALWALYFFIINVCAGGLILRLLDIAIEEHGIRWFLSTAYLAGYLLLTSSAWIYLMTGGMLDRTPIVLLWTAVMGVLFIFVQRRGPSTDSWKVSKCSRGYALIEKDKCALAAAVLLSLIIAAVAGLAVMTPTHDWDGMSHWILKAKVFFHHKQFAFDYTHVNIYPILWPLNIAIQFAVAGSMSDQLAQWNSAVFFMVLVMPLMRVLEIMKIRKTALYFTLAFFVANSFQNLFMRGLFNFVYSNAENIFLAFLSGAVFSLWFYTQHKDQHKFLILGFIMAVGVGLAKLEGALTVLFLVIALIFALYGLPMQWRGHGIKQVDRRIIFVIGLFAFAILLPVGWGYWIKVNGYYAPEMHFGSLASPAKVLYLLKLNLCSAMQNSTVIIAIGAIFCQLGAPNRRPWNDGEKFLLYTSLLMVLFSSFAYIGWSMEDIERNFAEVHARLFLHAAPSLLLVWGSRFFGREEEPSPERREGE